MSGALFDLRGRTAVVTGATGALGGAVARGIARAGAQVALVARRPEPLAALATELGAAALAVACDVRDRASREAARAAILERFGSVELLLDFAGGNVSAATLAPEASPFDVDLDAVREVVDLNLLGALGSIATFGPALQASPADDRAIVTVSSMAAERALTRVGGYGAAKAALEAATRWLAVELGRRGAGIRVNTIAPGFFVGDQNRALLLRPDGTPTERGRTIVEKTPLGRLGDPADLVSTAIWLCGPGAGFVTGAVIPVDGGFSAFSGV